MIHDMVTNSKIQGNDRIFWLLGFLFLGVLTAVYYYFTEYHPVSRS
jgi:hypothetical protein